MRERAPFTQIIEQGPPPASPPGHGIGQFLVPVEDSAFLSSISPARSRSPLRPGLGSLVWSETDWLFELHLRLGHVALLPFKSIIAWRSYRRGPGLS
jgi:hypothetical protein